MRLYNIIRDDDENDLQSKIFDAVIISLIIINVLNVLLETFDLPSKHQAAFRVVEIVSLVIFIIEYILRIWTSDLIYPDLPPARARRKYACSFLPVIDLLGLVSFFWLFFPAPDLQVLRFLRNLRLIRLIKMDRYVHALSSITDVFKKKRHQLASSIFLILVLMLMTSLMMYSIENKAQPEVFDSAFSGLWWAFATFTTVGYGDIYPITPMGKILSSVTAFLGIVLFAVPTGIISAGFIAQVDRESKSSDENIKYCPHCGKQLNK